MKSIGEAGRLQRVPFFTFLWEIWNSMIWYWEFQFLFLVEDASYIQTQRSDVPYQIAKITEIKVTKAGHAEFVTRPFHRLDDLPDQIYRKLTVDREAECKSMPKIIEKLKDNLFAKRELFICDAEDAQEGSEKINFRKFQIYINIYYFILKSVKSWHALKCVVYVRFIITFRLKKRLVSLQLKKTLSFIFWVTTLRRESSHVRTKKKKEFDKYTIGTPRNAECSTG